ncbi:MAG TPA: HDOD domain-containing protein [Spirochaetota bacterium]|jgi:putative nucleotidyltransferase with HDIG domain|nr:HDOD domain-containing protein [Spirochaetota bacterium]HOK93471.1 HDOD domain-containing protein [Spirochaetota bacterium]HON16499.1 HDOD domain-containing protein [Spirochaetota bacterium]HPP96173.1 HDOD domain-containing protein [Spirochaetota bacterium]
MTTQKTSIISSQILQGEKVRLSFHYNNKEITKFINSVFTKVLSNIDLMYLEGVVENITRELIVNAVKANSKRVYFKQKKLNIEDPQHYEQAIADFKDFLIENSNKLPEILKEEGFRVELNLWKKDDGIIINVKNNTPLLPIEEERINHRINQAKQFNDFSEIYLNIADDSEGEGLGIPLTILFLKNSGLNESYFKIKSDGTSTQSYFKIPITPTPKEIETEIKEKIIAEITELPTFPEHVFEIQEMCKNRDVTLSAISAKISLDPALSASVLKLANSALFMPPKQIDNIKEALKIIGLKNLNSILIAATAKKIMDDKFSSFKDIWDHCNKTAFYARDIALNSGLKNLGEKIFLAGLLHDLGKIVLLSINKDLAERIETITSMRQMRTSTALEEVAIGLSHGAIGRLIAEKWNFPEYISEAIAHHHCPVNKELKYKEITESIYIANCMTLIEEKKFDFMFIEDSLLQKFNLQNKSIFENFHKELQEKYSASSVV